MPTHHRASLATLRARRSAPVVSVALVAALLGACQPGGGSSQAGAAPEAAAATPANSLLDGRTSLAALLLTGRDGGDTDGYWECDTESGATVPLRFWGDGNGVAGRRAMSWQTGVDDDSVELRFVDGATTHLDGITFGEDAFEARDRADESIDCTYMGKRYGAAATGVLSDGSNGLAGALLTRADEDWSCVFEDAAGTVLSRLIGFHADGSGVVDGIDSTWFVDERGYVVIVAEQERLVLTDVQTTPRNVSESEPATALRAMERSYSVDCRR